MRSPANQGCVVVTGGSRGIGAEVVKLCAQAGFDVCFTYQSRKDRADEVVTQCEPFTGRVLALQADVRDGERSQWVLDEANKLSQVVGLVNNVGITSQISSFLDVDVASMRNVLETNVLGLMVMSQSFVRHWSSCGLPGNIVNISSMAAVSGSPGEYIHYAASKAAVDSFTIGLAKEFAKKSIRVNAVAPGIIDTDIHTLSGEPGRAARVGPNIPMGRPGQAQEVAQAVVWLLSGQASYVTATVLKVAGGV